MPSNTSLRNKDLIARARHIAYKARMEGRSLTLDALAEATRASQPLHFYQNYDRASQVLHRIERCGINAIVASAENRAMWLDLYMKVEKVLATRPRLNFSQALTHVLVFGRPDRFYLQKDTVRRLISPHFMATITEIEPGRA